MVPDPVFLPILSGCNVLWTTHKPSVSLFIPWLSQLHNLQLPLLQLPIYLTTSQTSFTQGILSQTFHYLTTTWHLSSSLALSILNLIFYIIESSGTLTSPIILQDVKSLPGLISFLSQSEPHNSEPLFYQHPLSHCTFAFYPTCLAKLLCWMNWRICFFCSYTTAT